ncbi:MAG TPA: HAD family phosphatase [Terriglobia bacterium]|nr:HAD family phosphatase [Terriglobia bacterium]
MTQPRAVIFDYGNVLCIPQQPSDVEKMAAICRMPVPRFAELYWRFRLAYDRAELNGDAYWGSVMREEGRTLSPDEVAQLIQLDGASWARPNPATLRGVERLRAAGVPLAILSNMPPEIKGYILEHCGWLSAFQYLVFSCDVALVKPDPAIYEECLKKLKLAPHEVLFLDDRPENVQAAAKLGIYSAVFDTAENAFAWMSQHLDFPSFVSTEKEPGLPAKCP